MPSADFYVVFEPEWSRSPLRPDVLTGMKPARMTKRRPDRVAGVVVHFEVTLPDSAFQPLRPQVTIEVGEGQFELPVVTVIPPAEREDDGPAASA